MKELLREFEKLEAVFIKRLSSLVNEASLNAFISMLSDYQTKAEKIAVEIEDKEKNIKEENEILRSISGLTDTDIRAKLLEAGEEARFLRKQLIDLKKDFDKISKDKDSLIFKIEQRKVDDDSKNKERDRDRQKFEKELEGLKAKLDQMKEEYKSKEKELDEVKESVKGSYLVFEKKVRAKVYAEVGALIGKMRDYCGIVASTSEFCAERWGGVKNKLSKAGSKINLNFLEGKTEKPLFEITADLDLINQYSKEAIKTLDVYLELSSLTEPKLDKMSWQVFWDNTKKKYFDVLVKYKIKITWPSLKKYPDFVTDQVILSEICGLLIQNSIEALPKDGEIAVSGEFSEEKTILWFSDNGIGIKKDDRDKIFLPFFTTKPGHKGLGLYKVFKLMEILNGSIKFEAKKNGSLFTVEIPGYRIIK